MAAAPRHNGPASPVVTTHPNAGIHELDDDELLYRARHGDDRALEVLVTRYWRFARHRSRGYFLLGGTREDVEQEALIGLVEAVRDFRPARGTSFRAFAAVCITRQILTAIRSAASRKHEALNSHIPLDVAHDAIPRALGAQLATTYDDPADVVVALESLQRMRAVIVRRTSRFEMTVLALRLDGRTYTEIGDALGAQFKAIDNAIQRTRTKLHPVLQGA